MVKEIHKKNLTFVTVEADEIDKIIQELKIDVVKRENNIIQFKNILKADTLIKKLSKYKIDNILIEEATLEDIFLHYYK